MSPAEQGGSVEVNSKKRGIFITDGSPVVFFFHQSVTEGARDALFTKIQENGGDVSNEREGADVLLYDPKRTKEALLITAYGAHSNAKLRDLWLRPVAHLERSIDAQSFELLLQVMPDSGGGTARFKKFSQDDKQHLGQYLASRVPVAANSISIYNELVDLYTVDPEEYEWVQRHSATSWRAHYKNNKAYYDALINDYICQYGPAHDRHRCSPAATQELSRGVKRPNNYEKEEEQGAESPEYTRFLTRKRRKTCAALEEEERRQRIIARRKEEEEDSEEDLAPAPAPRACPTPGPSGTIPCAQPLEPGPQLEGPLDEETLAPLFLKEDKNMVCQLPLEDFVEDEDTPAPLFSEEEDEDEDQPLADSLDADQVSAPLFSEDEDGDSLFTVKKEETQFSLFTQVEEDKEAQGIQNPPSTQALSHALARFRSRRIRKSSEDIGARTKLKEMQNLSRQSTPYLPPSGSRAAKHLLQRSL